MKTVNKFLEASDMELASFQCIRKEFEYIYCKTLKKKAETFGAKFRNQTKIHWSRDWEYPWAVINSSVRKGDRILDCGCGGSPLLPFFQQYGCEAYGIAPNIFKRISLWNYYADLAKRVLEKLGRQKKVGRGNNPEDTIKHSNALMSTHSYRNFLRLGTNALLHPPNNLSGSHTDPNKLGFKIKFFNDSLDQMHFPDNYFDKVFCISVIEHLPTEAAYRGMKEMARVLKEDGFLVVTVDNDGQHVNSELVNSHEKLIDASGLQLCGESDFTMPSSENVPGTYNVVGFILKK